MNGNYKYHITRMWVVSRL